MFHKVPREQHALAPNAHAKRAFSFRCQSFERVILQQLSVALQLPLPGCRVTLLPMRSSVLCLRQLGMLDVSHEAVKTSVNLAGPFIPVVATWFGVEFVGVVALL